MTAPDAYFSYTLQQFLGGYFNQDWDMWGENTQRVLDVPVRDLSRAELVEVVEALSELIAEGYGEADLESVLVRHTCEYYPPGDDGVQTHAEWIEEIAQRLTAELAPE